MLNDLAVMVSFALAVLIRFSDEGLGDKADRYSYLLFGMLLLSVLLDWIYAYDDTIRKRGYFEEAAAIMKKTITFMVVLIITLFLVHMSTVYSRLVLGYFALVNYVITYLVHIIYKQVARKAYQKSKYTPRMVVVAPSCDIEKIVAKIENDDECEKVITGVALLDIKKDEEVEAKLGTGILKTLHIVANCDSIVDYVVHHEVDEVFIVDKRREYSELIKSFLPDIISAGVLVNVNINVYELAVQNKKALGHMGDYAVVSYSRNVLTHNQKVAKRLLDICGSLVGMLVLMVANIFIAPAIKLTSKGPVFFRQTRVGKNGRKFTFYKYRTMYEDAEQRKAELMEQNESDGYMFKMSDDPRVTKVGAFLRRTSLDELPQFWNILIGDMSLVGTRPPTVDEYEKYNAKHRCRLSMTPGLTGMWQVSGRSDIKSFEDVVKLDMEYIDDWSIKKDIKILLQTMGVVFSGRGAR